MTNAIHRATRKLFVEKHSLKHRFSIMLLVLLIAVLQCIICACNMESDTKIEVVANTNPPVFKLKGSGNITRFVIYGPLVGKYANEEDRPVLWKIFPDGSSTSKPISGLAPIKYSEVPSGWTQYTPKNEQPLPFVDGAIYRVVANVNSANSGYIDITVRDGKVFLIR